MAMRDEIRYQRSKLKGKGIKAHLKWFVDYNLVTTIVVVAIAAMLLSVVISSVTSKDSAFGVMFINASLADDQDEELEADFAEYAGIDTQKYDLFLDLSENRSIGETEGSMDYYSAQSIFVRIAAQQVDVLAADVYTFESFLNGYYVDLREVLDEETLQELEEEGLIYYAEASYLAGEESEEEEEEQDGEESSSESDVQEDTEGDGQEDTAQEDAEETTDTEDTSSSWLSSSDSYVFDSEIMEEIHPDNYVLPDPAAMEDPVPAGIVVNSAPYFQNNHNFDNVTAVLGVLSNSEHMDICQTFVDYIFEK